MNTDLSTSQSINKYRYLISFLAIGLIYFLNMLIDVMEVDAAQYASIAREMWETKSFLQVYNHGADYLDKPPLLFWLSSLSIGVLGLSNFAYKLPAILVIVLGIYSTYRFSLLYYSRRKAIYAALILATTQALFLVTNDVRTDGILTGFIIFSVWQISEFLRTNKYKYLILGSIGVAAAMMTKGPIGIVLVGFAIGGDFIVKRQWSNFLKWEWILLLIIVALLLVPMTYGLYTQFDLHPEKEVYGLSGPSGVRFFYWTQSFGRITGENYWKNDAGFFFFFHTILWDFQPWVLFLIPALFIKTKNLILSNFRIPNNQEYMSFSLFVIGFLALSKSGFKLPHYIFPLFPFAAIMVADYIGSLENSKFSRRFSRFQFGLMHVFFLAAPLSFIYFFSPSNIILPLIVALAYIAFVLAFIKTKDVQEKVMMPTLIAIITFGILMSSYFYPNILEFQAESNVGKEIHKRDVEKNMFFLHNVYGQSIDFYSDRICPDLIPDYSDYKKGTLVFTDENGKFELTKENGPGYEVDKIIYDYHVTGLSLDFLLKSSREESLEKKYLLVKE